MPAPTQPAAPVTPITPELWERLRRFDPHCEISIMRTVPTKRWRERGIRRCWQVNIHPIGMDSYHWVHAEHPTLAVAMREAIEAAERKNWAR